MFVSLHIFGIGLLLAHLLTGAHDLVNEQQLVCQDVWIQDILPEHQAIADASTRFGWGMGR
jgi:hypothetical protein